MAPEPNILLDVSVLAPNEKGPVVAVAVAGVSKEMLLVTMALGAVVLSDFPTAPTPNPNDNGDFSVPPNIGFDKFVADGVGCNGAGLIVAGVVCFSALSFDFRVGGIDVALVVCCIRGNTCMGWAGAVAVGANFGCVCCG